MIDAPLEIREWWDPHEELRALPNTFNQSFRHFPMMHFGAFVRKATEKIPASYKKNKHYIKHLHTNWSSVRGLTDTSALRGGLEIKTTGSEPRDAGVHAVLRERRPFVMSYNSRAHAANVCITQRKLRARQADHWLSPPWQITPNTHNEWKEYGKRLTLSRLIIRRHIGSLQEERR